MQHTWSSESSQDTAHHISHHNAVLMLQGHFLPTAFLTQLLKGKLLILQSIY